MRASKEIGIIYIIFTYFGALKMRIMRRWKFIKCL